MQTAEVSQGNASGTRTKYEASYSQTVSYKSEKDASDQSRSQIPRPINDSMKSQEKLRSLASESLKILNWKRIDNIARQCDWKRNRDGFAVFRTKKQSLYYVMAVGTLKCSAKELQNAMREPNTKQYNDTMAAFFGSDFTHGRVEHTDNIQLDIACLDEQAPHALHESGSLLTCDVYLKSASFSKANVFSRPEWWSYLDFVIEDTDQKGFHKCWRSVENRNSSYDVRGKKIKSSQLHDVVAGFSIREKSEYLDNLRKPSVRVLFYAQCSRNGRNITTAFSKSKTRTTRKRLDRMANAMPRLHALMRRRRLGAQTLIQKSSVRASNRYCISCSQSFKQPGNKKGQCDLCGFFVCLLCCTIEQRETKTQQTSKVLVCHPCMARVNACNYENVPYDDLMVPTIIPSSPESPSIASVLADLLEETFKSVDQTKKRSVIRVMKHLLELDEGNDEIQGSGESQSDLGSLAGISTEYVDAVRRKDFEQIPLEKCVLANTESRSYPLVYKSGKDTIPDPLVSKSEHERLKMIKDKRLVEMGDVEELNIVCRLAARELECQVGFIMIIDESTQHVVATSDEQFRDLKLPRNQSVCTHLLMNDKPLLVPHLEADVRFHDLEVVKSMKKKFYCGFPIIGDNNVILASVCCIDEQTRQVSDTQYSAMQRLASTASRILHLRGSVAKCDV
uniref:GAF domaincontaining protein putative n=1 Tax=Albugo laibachii Nc14 TaxID=890382 RepID=F0WJI4_9STRA|nr:GAF domaincontaining protein putative [Albugo laibachii Nc14]|eukprot:CCA21433.1 GAF domaincontaining protein putative [Albugo laibachii Nc14]